MSSQIPQLALKCSRRKTEPSVFPSSIKYGNRGRWEKFRERQGCILLKLRGHSVRRHMRLLKTRVTLGLKIAKKPHLHIRVRGKNTLYKLNVGLFKALLSPRRMQLILYLSHTDCL